MDRLSSLDKAEQEQRDGMLGQGKAHEAERRDAVTKQEAKVTYI